MHTNKCLHNNDIFVCKNGWKICDLLTVTSYALCAMCYVYVIVCELKRRKKKRYKAHRVCLALNKTSSTKKTILKKKRKKAISKNQIVRLDSLWILTISMLARKFQHLLTAHELSYNIIRQKKKRTNQKFGSNSNWKINSELNEKIPGRQSYLCFYSTLK